MCSTAVIASLVERFHETMKTPVMRKRALINAARNGNYFVAKGSFGQVVALRKAYAPDVLELLCNDGKDAVQLKEFTTMETQLPTLADLSAA